MFIHPTAMTADNAVFLAHMCTMGVAIGYYMEGDPPCIEAYSYIARRVRTRN